MASLFSTSSNKAMNALFKSMFSHSKTASYYSISESKYNYIRSFGIGPYFIKRLADEVKEFDESLNKEL